MMKKLIALIPFLAIFSHSITYAYDELLKNSNYTESNRRKIYLKVTAGAALINDTKDTASKLKMTSKSAPHFAVGVGTYFMDNTRVDLTFEHATNPVLKKSSAISLNNFVRTGIGQSFTNSTLANEAFTTNGLMQLGFKSFEVPLVQQILSGAFNLLNTTSTIKNIKDAIIQASINIATAGSGTTSQGRNNGQAVINHLTNLQNNASTQDLYYLLTQDLSTISVSTSVNHKATVNTFMVNGAIDLYEFNRVKLFMGAGIGAVQLKEKISITSTLNLPGKKSVIIDESTSTKKANNFAYSLTAGTSAKINDKVTVELAYSWKDFGKTKSAKIQSVEVGKTPYRSHTLTAGIRIDV